MPGFAGWRASSRPSAGRHEAIGGGRGRLRVFSSSWGQLESGGSNIGDLAIFASQVRDLSRDFDLGVLSSDPAATKARFGATGFSTGRGRLGAMLRGVLWADAVIVGGGELVQDRSSLLYSPFNLLPLRLAWWLRRPSFAWSVGIGLPSELAPWTPGQVRRWVGRARGITARDLHTHDYLVSLGLDPVRVVHTADSAFSLAGDYRPGPVRSDILGAAPRDVSNRRGGLLPLEIRRKLRMSLRESGDGDLREWAGALDRHIEINGGRVRLFAFHTGPLSNSDDSACAGVLSLMRHSDRAELARADTLDEFLALLAGCRVVLTAPLHGAILSVVTGAVPVAVPYSSKIPRFMEEAGLGASVVPRDSAGWGAGAVEMLTRAWRDADGIWRELGPGRERLAGRCTLNSMLFRDMIKAGS